MRLVAVVGSKRSGKTTVVERMLPALRARGLSVATLKLIHHSQFDVHAEATDTARHWEAGSEATLALAPGQTALVRRTDGAHEGLADAMALLPGHIDCLLMEGRIAGGSEVRTVLCAREADRARALLAELPGDANVVAVAGPVAGGLEELDGLPVLDARHDGDRDTLVELALG